MLFWRNRHEVSDVELSAFVDGELEEPVRRRVERHLESCASCGETVAELQAVSRAMSELPAVRAPRSFALREADVLPATGSEGGRLLGRATPLLSGIAAIAIVAFVVLVGVDITGNGSSDFDAPSRTIPLGQDEAALSGAESSEATISDDGNDQESDDDALAADMDAVAGEDVDAPSEEIEEEPANSPEGGDEGSIAPVLADEDGDSTGLRVAEIVVGAVAIAAAGSVLLIWWRRRTAAS